MTMFFNQSTSTLFLRMGVVVVAALSLIYLTFRHRSGFWRDSLNLILAFVVSILDALIVVAFFALQIVILQQTSDWVQTVLLCLSVIVELALLAWHALFVRR